MTLHHLFYSRNFVEFCNKAGYKIPCVLVLVFEFISRAVFREKFLETFLPLPAVRSIRFVDIDTQSPAGGGQPDMAIASQDVHVLFEVKTELWRALTANQPEGYLDYLMQNDMKAKYRVLIFILPQGYSHEEKLKERAESYANKHTIVSILNKGSSALEDAVQWGIIYWEDIIHIIEENELHRFNPFLNEFTKLLKNWYFPSQIIFKKSEVRMMFSKTIPEAIKTLKKLQTIVDSIEQRNKKFKAQSYRSEKAGEYGISFKDAEGKNVLWFGIWYDCWENTEIPIIYGVGKDETEEARKIFMEHLPPNRRKNWEDFDFGWFDQVTLLDENPVELIWNELEPLLEKMTNAS